MVSIRCRVFSHGRFRIIPCQFPESGGWDHHSFGAYTGHRPNFAEASIPPNCTIPTLNSAPEESTLTDILVPKSVSSSTSG
ncbi:hypothetical protein OROHE_010044 [Orobanche hederae]